MTLQTSGPISFSQLQTEYGGSAPISLSEYYRGGSYVPTTISQTAGSWSSWKGDVGNNWTLGIFRDIDYNGVQVNGTLDTNTSSTSFYANGYDYERGTVWNTYTDTSSKFPVTYTQYRIRRRVAAATITVNANVPSSGTIDMADFYGGRNS
jgi:hypothetical protein